MVSEEIHGHPEQILRDLMVLSSSAMCTGSEKMNKYYLENTRPWISRKQRKWFAALWKRKWMAM